MASRSNSRWPISPSGQLSRSQSRRNISRISARGLAAILSVLLVVFGYLKLEDATKGYYTLLLRLTALAVLVGAGLCLWTLG